MLHFMIDFENVRNQGLDGCEYLKNDDKITIFYSTSCMQMENVRMKHILASGCEFDICKLVKTGKNALDFYIASRIGEEYGKGYQGAVAIISNDKGFLAVQEYWKSRPSPRRIILKGTIEQSIVSVNENDERHSLILQKKKNISIETEFEKYKERQRIQQEITELFKDTEYMDDLGKIMDIIQMKKTPKVLYLDTLKEFGRKDGLEIYRKIKGGMQCIR